MKKERNCMGNNIGVPMYQPAMPAMPMPQTFPTAYPTAYPTTYPNTYQNSYSNVDQQLSFMQQQISMLDERVSKLEGKNNSNYSNKYNDSNYYML